MAFGSKALRKFQTTSLQAAGLNDSWIKILQVKTNQGSMAAHTRPYESGELTEAYIKGYPRLRVFGQEASAQQVKEQADRIAELEAALLHERMAKSVYEEKTTRLEVGLEDIISRLSKLEEEKNKS